MICRKLASALAAVCLAGFITSCTAAPKSAPIAVNPDIREARELLDTWGGDGEILAQAHTRLLRVLKANPDDYLALKELARYQIMSGYINSRYVEYKKNIYTVGNYSPGALEQAEASIRHAIRVNPSFAEGYVLLGHIQFQQTNIDEAAKTLTRAEQLGTDDPWLQLNWASVQAAMGDYAAANRRAERVLASNTTNHKARGSAYEQLISGYEQTGEFGKEVELYRKHLREEPNDAWLHGNFAAFLTHTMGQNDEAIEQARAALQIMDYGMGERTLAMALYGKWADLVAQGRGKDGEAYFQEAYEIFPALDEVMAYAGSELAGEKLAKALVVRKHVSVDARADDGSTALLIATNRKRVAVVRNLLSLHANPNIRDANGWTPLLSAADEGSTEIVNMLLAKGADIQARAPWNGGDAAFFAEQSGNAELAAMLRKRAMTLK